MLLVFVCFFFFSSRRRHTRYWRDWSSDVCSSDLPPRHKHCRTWQRWLQIPQPRRFVAAPRQSASVFRRAVRRQQCPGRAWHRKCSPLEMPPPRPWARTAPHIASGRGRPYLPEPSLLSAVKCRRRILPAHGSFPTQARACVLGRSGRKQFRAVGRHRERLRHVRAIQDELAALPAPENRARADRDTTVQTWLIASIGSYYSRRLRRRTLVSSYRDETTPARFHACGRHRSGSGTPSKAASRSKLHSHIAIVHPLPGNVELQKRNCWHRPLASRVEEWLAISPLAAESDTTTPRAHDAPVRGRHRPCRPRSRESLPC